jgi:uncharacterized membrane protein
MFLIILLIILLLIALIAVTVINQMQLTQRKRRLEQRRLRVQVEEMIELVNCLEQTMPNRMIAKVINDQIIELQKAMLDLEDGNPDAIEASIRVREELAEALLDPSTRQPITYQRESDAQIAKTQLHLNDAVKLLQEASATGAISDAEYTSYVSELRWAYLMVSVMSYMGQGDKSMMISDRISAIAFYRKAQQLLMESMHQDPRRLKMIKEISEIIEGSRASLSPELDSSAVDLEENTEDTEPEL